MGTKVTYNPLTSLENETSAVNNINNNLQTLADAFDNTISRDGTTPNVMEANLDMGGFKIMNLGAPINPTDPLRLIDGQTGVQGTPGVRGSEWFIGHGTPTYSATTQINLDMYLDLSTYNVWQLTVVPGAGTWNQVGNVQGPMGANGTNGTNGTRGSVWDSGSGAPGTISGQLNNDVYVDTATFNLYQLQSGSWVLIGNIKGPTGSGSGDMLRSNNLTDLTNKPQALTNIGAQPAAANLTTLAGLASVGNLSTLAGLASVANLSTVAGYTGTQMTNLGSYASTAPGATGLALVGAANAGAARTTLGLTAPATANYGTAAGTVAQGNDSRFTVMPPTGIPTNWVTNPVNSGNLFVNTQGGDNSVLLYSPGMPVGASFTFRNPPGMGRILLQSNSFTLRQASSSTAQGVVTIASPGMCTLIHEAAGVWVVIGTGIS